MKKMLLVVSTLLCCSPAFANSFKMTFNQVMALRGALAALDGAPQIIKDGSRETSVIVPYKLGAGMRLLIARDIASADKLISTVRTAAKPVAEELQRLQGANASQGEIGKATAAINALGEEEQTIDLEPINTKELALDQNQVPASNLAALAPILVDN
jgi:hypothetical protein